MIIQFQVPVQKFEAMAKSCSCQSICESQKAKETVFWQNQEYVICSAIGNGTGTGWASIGGYAVTDLEKYKGDLKPLQYDLHYVEVNAGNRERAYTGMMLICGKRKLVMLDKVKFTPVEKGKQLDLF